MPITTNVISNPIRWHVLHTTLYDKVCLWFSPVSFTKKNDHQNITQILLKVALNTTTPILCNTVPLIYLWPPIICKILNYIDQSHNSSQRMLGFCTFKFGRPILLIGGRNSKVKNTSISKRQIFLWGIQWKHICT